VDRTLIAPTTIATSAYRNRSQLARLACSFVMRIAAEAHNFETVELDIVQARLFAQLNCGAIATEINATGDARIFLPRKSKAKYSVTNYNIFVQ
jgi:hypothetical protein